MSWDQTSTGTERDGRYRQLVEQLDMPMVVHDQGILTFVTQATATLVGAESADELRGRSLLDFIHPDDQERAVTQMLRSFEGEPVGRDRYRVVRLDGGVRWVEGAATPIVLEGQLSTLVVIEDVTARLEAETRLQESELRYRALVQNSRELVAVVRDDGRITYACPAAEAMLARADLVGEDFGTLLHPDDRAGFAARMASLVQGVENHTVVATCRVQDREGDWRHVELIATNHLDDPVIDGIVINGRDVTERVAAHADLRRLALHDPLTNLANRALIEERVHQALRAIAGEQRTAVVAIDLDSFKDINDSFGHAIGDIVLLEVAERLRRAVRSGDTVGRAGGDEFVLVLPRVDRIDTAVQTVRRILRAIEEPIEHEGSRFRLTASAGIAFAPDHGGSSDELLRAADAAMYRAKRVRNGPAVFNDHDRDHSLARLSLSTELADAVDGGDFLLHYQPKYDLATGTLSGVEALLRWNHPHHGIIAPGEFLALAEDTGLIRPITSWVLDTALAQARRWYDDGSDLTVALNLSPSSLQDTGFVTEIDQALQRHGVPADRLVLEVTEQTVMANSEAAREVMRELTRTGVSFSIDDFGTGYSSLTYLRILPVGELKIDRSFIRDGNGEIDHDIVETIVTLGRRLGLRVVAEGIESAEAAAELRAIGCDVGQGYHLGRPGPAEDIDTGVGPRQRAS